MVLEPQGFVARIAEDLERSISQGKLPKDGSLPSEQSLARFYGVSRSTVREALKQLATRGLVVQQAALRVQASLRPQGGERPGVFQVLGREAPE